MVDTESSGDSADSSTGTTENLSRVFQEVTDQEVFEEEQQDTVSHDTADTTVDEMNEVIDDQRKNESVKDTIE